MDRPLGRPELGEESYLLDVFHEAGPTLPTPMGETPLTWTEVWSYAQATEAVSEPWEMRLLIDMSRAWLNARTKGEEPASVSPADRWQETDENGEDA